MQQLEEARRALNLFAGQAAEPGDAPKYAALARIAAEDDGIAELLAAAPATQRHATLFFAALHYTMLRNPQDPLAEWFSVNEDSADPEVLLRGFCGRHHDALRDLIMFRKTQTNEVQRSSHLVLMLSQVAQQASRPIALVEPGAAAGLNLLLDHYFYDWGTAGTMGDAGAFVKLSADVLGSLPSIATTLPVVRTRIGIDLAPVNLEDDDAVLWLRACVWAEHRRRGKVLEQAIDFARSRPPAVIAGDAVELLPDVLDQLSSADVAVCVMHSAFLPYLSEAQRQAFVERLVDASHRYPVHWIVSEGWGLVVPMFQLEEPPRPPGADYSLLGVICTLDKGRVVTRLVLRAAPHGRWLQWLADD
ncbi:MAG TPA: DUF2332 domain-containing protein [Actinomycetota bacterium]|nr:DUF2332 domain-containing protein [Actinomycetota bacterium]